MINSNTGINPAITTNINTSPVVNTTPNLSQGWAEVNSDKNKTAIHSTRDQFISATGDQFIPSQDKTEKEMKEWTILAYLDGANELREFMTGDLKEMEAVGSTDKTDVVTLLSRDSRKWTSPEGVAENLWDIFKGPEKRIAQDWKGARVFHVQKGDPDSKEISSTLIEDKGRVPVNDPKTLQEFIEMGMTKYPARHYMLVLADHGMGEQGILLDRDGKPMKLPDVQSAIETASQNTGKKVDVLVLEACQMGQMEVAYQLKGSADYMVASPGKLYDNAFNYQEILGRVKEHQDKGENLTPEEMANVLVESTEKSYEDTPYLTALDLSRMVEIRKSLDEFADALKKTDTPKEVIKKIIEDTPDHDRSVYKKDADKPQVLKRRVDIIGLCNRFARSTEVKDFNLRLKSANLKNLIDASTVNRKFHYGDPDDQGLSILMPTDRTQRNPVNDEYRQLALSQDSLWADFIDKELQKYL